MYALEVAHYYSTVHECDFATLHSHDIDMTPRYWRDVIETKEAQVGVSNDY